MLTDDFLRQLCSLSGELYEGIYLEGRRQGWLEEEDYLNSSKDITRKNVARILHLYLLKRRGIKDIGDITEAYKLRDLFDCRVCANHVAQVYLREIMPAKNLSREGEFLWFDLDGEDSIQDNVEYIKRALNQEPC
ncbi:MAG: hypothetical protein MJ103_06000 [Saccharofermentans sp.]|nr:hypothetical protein [Saccharofermentans sp.]